MNYPVIQRIYLVIADSPLVKPTITRYRLPKIPPFIFLQNKKNPPLSLKNDKDGVECPWYHLSLQPARAYHLKTYMPKKAYTLTWITSANPRRILLIQRCSVRGSRIMFKRFVRFIPTNRSSLGDILFLLFPLTAYKKYNFDDCKSFA